MLWVLETERLRLRRFTEDDAAALFNLERDPEILRHIGRKPLADVDAYRRHIQSRFLPYYGQSDGYGPWAIIEKSSGDFLGGCSLKPAFDSPVAVEMGFHEKDVEVGYGLRRLSWGNGYATELVQALVRKAFKELGAVCVVANVSVANLGSIRVLEKAGLRQIGEPIYLQGEDQPSLKYVINRSQMVGIELTTPQQRALRRLVGILEESGAPYQFTGGFAGNLHGSRWPLHDLDGDVGQADLPRPAQLLRPYTTWPLGPYVDHEFELQLLRAEIEGVGIDISQVEEAYARVGGQRVPLGTSLLQRQRAPLLDMEVWVQSLDELISYKELLGRWVDVADLRALRFSPRR